MQHLHGQPVISTPGAPPREQFLTLLLPSLPWSQAILLASWVLSMIGLPIARWLRGDEILPWAVTLNVLLLVAATATIVLPALRTRVRARLLLVTLPGAWLLEFVGLHTGFPFGDYDYTNVLQPQLGGVPLLIPFAWLMFLPPAWAIAAQIAKRSDGLVFVTLSALAFTAWDLFLDPQMVAWHFWVWESHGGYFGIPWLNFVGWFMGSWLLTAIVRPGPLPLRPLVLVYAITWILQTIGQFAFWQMPGPALAGFLAMGFFVVAAWWQR